MLVRFENSYQLLERQDTALTSREISLNNMVVYSGETETGYDGKLYVKGHAPEAPTPTYAEQREAAYPSLVDQLDSLYHDIDAGKFGETAKSADFYLDRKAVKEKYPKPVETTD